tara:strand:+ start:2578 stop:2865 length:288 start_codon:yes stop_codon:yes gene_type:complete
MTEENQAPETQEQEQAPGLSLNDISAAVQIIDVATARGAIRGEELLPVGTVRQRFMAFLEHAKAQGQDVNLPGDAPVPPTDAEAPVPSEAEVPAS